MPKDNISKYIQCKRKIRMLNILKLNMRRIHIYLYIPKEEESMPNIQQVKSIPTTLYTSE